MAAAAPQPTMSDKFGNFFSDELRPLVHLLLVHVVSVLKDALDDFVGRLQAEVPADGALKISNLTKWLQPQARPPMQRQAEQQPGSSKGKHVSGYRGSRGGKGRRRSNKTTRTSMQPMITLPPPPAGPIPAAAACAPKSVPSDLVAGSSSNSEQATHNITLAAINHPAPATIPHVQQKRTLGPGLAAYNGARKVEAAARKATSRAVTPPKELSSSPSSSQADMQQQQQPCSDSHAATTAATTAASGEQQGTTHAAAAPQVAAAAQGGGSARGGSSSTQPCTGNLPSSDPQQGGGAGAGKEQAHAAQHPKQPGDQRITRSKAKAEGAAAMATRDRAKKKDQELRRSDN